MHVCQIQPLQITVQFVTNLSKYWVSPPTIVSDNFNIVVINNVSILRKNISTCSPNLETGFMILLQFNRYTFF
jgi:hypothetical protein